MKKEIMSNGVRILAELGALRLSRALYGVLDESLYEKFKFMLLPNINEELIDEQEYSSLIENADLNLGFFTAHCMSEITLALIELIMLKTIEPSTVELMNELNDGNDDGVTLLTAARVCGYSDSIDEAIIPMREALKSVEFLLTCKNSMNNEFYLKPWNADTYLLTYLAGEVSGENVYEEFSERYDAEKKEITVFGLDDEIKRYSEELQKLLDNDVSFSIFVEGEKETGRYTLIKSVADKIGIKLLTVDFDLLRKSHNPKEHVRLIIRCCALENRALCIRNIHEDKENIFLINKIIEFYREHSPLPLFFIIDPNVKLIPTVNEQFISIKIPDTKAFTFALWNGYLPDEYKKYASSLSSKMRLKAGQINRVCNCLNAQIGADNKLDERAICKICYQVLDDGRYENVKWVSPGFNMDELKIDDQNRNILEDICNQVELRGKVYDEWNLKSRYAYGKCVSAIFAGPPGTGKTMAVHALASKLSLELYKVDLSQIADKYIGETEKRLEEVFSKAEKSNMILFFDEADAVMAKRSDVKDSHDKYANTEISFILQRIEEFDGIVILATNNLQNIDAAFMRRIRYVVNFRRPDSSTRKEIWMDAFGDLVPLDEDIDFDYLAETFDFSGGEIKNIILNAVFYGAAQSGKVSMKHIMKAVGRELTKGKNLTISGNYGKYSYMLRE